MISAVQKDNKSPVELLDPQELTFVLRLTEFPRKLTIGEAAEVAGYDAGYGYRKARTPRIRAAMDEILDERESGLKVDTQNVLRSLATRAVERGDNEAAKIYLEAVGRGSNGVRIVNNVTATTAVENAPLESRIAGLSRGELLPQD